MMYTVRLLTADGFHFDMLIPQSVKVVRVQLTTPEKSLGDWEVHQNDRNPYVATEQLCSAASVVGPLGSVKCSLSEGHTKPAEHWDGPKGVMFTVPEQHNTGYVVDPRPRIQCTCTAGTTLNPKLHTGECEKFGRGWETFPYHDPDCRDVCCRDDVQHKSHAGYDVTAERLAESHREGWHRVSGDRDCPLCHPEQHKSHYGAKPPKDFDGWRWFQCRHCLNFYKVGPLSTTPVEEEKRIALSHEKTHHSPASQYDALDPDNCEGDDFHEPYRCQLRELRDKGKGE